MQQRLGLPREVLESKPFAKVGQKLENKVKTPTSMTSVHSCEVFVQGENEPNQSKAEQSLTVNFMWKFISDIPALVRLFINMCVSH